MSSVVLKNAKVELDGTDYSSYVAGGTLTYRAELLDDTAMGDDNRSMLGGLKDWDLEVTFHQDYGVVDAKLFAILGTTACFEVRPHNTCATGINPVFSGICMLESYPPVTGGVGTLVDVTARFRPASTLSRNTSAT
jgi:hypothetical protein